MITVALTAWMLAAGPISAQVQTPPGGAAAAIPPRPEYITAPVWARSPSGDDVRLYQPARAALEGVAGGAIVDCVAREDGTLTDCRAIKVRPEGWDYEFAGPRIVSRCYRLRMKLPDGRSVAGMRVVVATIGR